MQRNDEAIVTLTMLILFIEDVEFDPLLSKLAGKIA